MYILEHIVLIIDQHANTDTCEGRVLNEIGNYLKQWELNVIKTPSLNDGLTMLKSDTNVDCVLLDWATVTAKRSMAELVKKIRSLNDKIPLFIMTEKRNLGELDVEVLENITGYIWKMEDTPYFIAGRIEEVTQEYIYSMLPPFYKELIEYTKHYKYAWHTPGHMGGMAFIKSPVGRLFYNFFGENVFRADLSVSVPELGSLMEHTGVTGEAEENAARLFGAEHTYFVTNGTSTANKIVLHSCVIPGDIVLVDRNCHKSLQHALTMTGATPVYFMPTRNALGIIGGIPLEAFDEKAIRAAIKASPLVKDKKAKPKLAVITNSTYDGLLYDVVAIKEKLGGFIDNLHFDEAWYAYAKFHSLYNNRFGMCKSHSEHHPTIYATQSTHKLLAAFSQASMVHVKSGTNKIDPDRFNEAFMMHTSTSPQYNIIASLDVAAKMMEGQQGHALIQDAIDEAISFRKKMAQIKEDILSSNLPEETKWFFDVWQPRLPCQTSFLNTPDEKLARDPSCWALNNKATWHGYENVPDGYMMLDPIKVSIVTPGTNIDGTMDEKGIPASLLARFLISRGIVDEKTGFYTFLLLFSIGVTRGKSATLITALLEFKKLFDQNVALGGVFPELLAEFPKHYDKMTIQEFAYKMHSHLKEKDIAKLSMTIYESLPEPVMTPSHAYHELVRGNTENIPLTKVSNRIAAVMLVPYPPGIPIIMPGERFDKNTQPIIEYLKILQDFDNIFPGFETETHGIIIKEEKGKKVYYVPCIVE